MANMVPPGGRPQSMKDDSVGLMGQMAFEPKTTIATFVYDYFLKKGKADLAKAILNDSDFGVRSRPRQKKSPNNAPNGMDDPMEVEKDELAKRVEHLPEPELPEAMARDSFLEDWWVVFWDIWSASKQRKASPAAQQYISQAQGRQMMNNRMMQQHIMQRGMGPNMGRMGPGDMQRAAANRNQINQMRANMANMNPQQVAQLQQHEMAGQQRPQSPMSGDAPSPKRARVDGQFGNNQINPNMAGQNRPGGVPMPNGPGQQPGMGMSNGLEMPNAPFGMAGNPSNRMPQFSGMNQNFPGMPKDFNGANGEMAGLEDMNIFPDAMRTSNLNGPPGSQQGGALADYQMQLMLLEQQNKKRLLMARQEQEVTSQAGGPPGSTQGPTMMGAGPGAPFQQGLSPRRNGQSPSPNDPSKRASSGGFDPSQMGGQGMAQQFFNTPMGGPTGMRPGAPGFPGGPGGPMNQAALEQMQRARGMAPGGWPGAAQGMQPGNMPGMQQGPGNQQQNPMPPPSAPNPGPGAGRTNPSSPAPGANPPTPQQQNKNAPANKNTKKDTAKDNKKAKPANKKGANNANAAPTTEAENANGPPTPTPPTPITPSAPNNPFGKGQPGPNINGQNNNQGAQPQPHNMPGNQQDANGVNVNNPFGSLGGDPNMQDDNFGGLDFGTVGDANDVLEGFDFDSFLNTGTDDNAFGGDFGFNMGGDGNEMGVRDV